MERSKKLGTEEAPTPPPAVKYPGIKTFNIPGEVREKAFEVLWERDNDNLSLPTMILDAIVKVIFLPCERLYRIISSRIYGFMVNFVAVSHRHETSAGGKYRSDWWNDDGQRIR